MRSSLQKIEIGDLVIFSRGEKITEYQFFGVPIVYIAAACLGVYVIKKMVK